MSLKKRSIVLNAKDLKPLKKYEASEWNLAIKYVWIVQHSSNATCDNIIYMSDTMYSYQKLQFSTTKRCSENIQSGER